MFKTQYHTEENISDFNTIDRPNNFLSGGFLSLSKLISCLHLVAVDTLSVNWCVIDCLINTPKCKQPQHNRAHCCGLNLQNWLWPDKSSVSVYMQDACWSWCNIISIDHQLSALASLCQRGDLILTRLSIYCWYHVLWLNFLLRYQLLLKPKLKPF